MSGRLLYKPARAARSRLALIQLLGQTIQIYIGSVHLCFRLKNMDLFAFCARPRAVNKRIGVGFIETVKTGDGKTLSRFDL